MEVRTGSRPLRSARKVRADLAEVAVHPDRRIHAAGDAERVEILPGALDRADQLLVGRGGQHLADRIAAVLRQHPGELSVLHLDQPAGRRDRCGRDAGKLERLAVADRDMAAGAHQMDRIVRRDAVELLAPRMALHVELELVVAARQHPFARTERLGARLDQAEQGVECRRVLRPRVDLQHAEAVGQQMQVRVDQARRREPAAQVDDPACRARSAPRGRRRSRSRARARPTARPPARRPRRARTRRFRCAGSSRRDRHSATPVRVMSKSCAAARGVG